MRDLDGSDTAQIEHVRKHFVHLAQTYGFTFMDPSPLELLSTLETKSGPAIRDEIYHFKDKGNREVALRFDFTMGLTRHAVSQKSARLPLKISGFGGVFRYDEPQKGRYRYFHQWNLEIYGKPTIEAEAELVEVTSRLFDSLQLKGVIIDLNHRELIESYISSVFGSQDTDLVSDILRAVDKTAKKPREQIIEEFEIKGYEREKLVRVLDFSCIKGRPTEILNMIDVTQLNQWDHLYNLIAMLEERGILNVRINFGIVRGLDYYSGMVFEVFVTDSNGGALAGGGRYDTLTQAFGHADMGAAGVAGGIERIIMAMQEQGLAINDTHQKVAVVYATPNVRGSAATIASMLRLSGVHTELDLAGRNLKKQMVFAAAKNATVTVIIGPRELESNKVTIRDMKTGKEQIIPIDILSEAPRSVLFNQERLESTS